MPRDTIVWLDWDSLFERPVQADRILSRARAERLYGPSQADHLRAAACLASALDHGRRPVALFKWLLANPRADLALRHEDAGQSLLAASRPKRKPRKATEESSIDPTPLGSLLGKYLKETP